MSEQFANAIIKTDFQQDVADYWNTHTNDPVNLALGELDGLYHHHYGIGDYDESVLRAPARQRDHEITKELHRLETAQADMLLDNFDQLGTEAHLLDGGSGRGGTSVMAHQRFGCRVDGVSISQYQVEFANDQATRRGIAEHVRFHFRNMLDTGLPSSEFQGVWNNETTMYVDLFELLAEIARLLTPSGRYICITGCYNDALGKKSEPVKTIDEHYKCNIHARSTYFTALAANGITPIKVEDLTPRTIPYWELRQQSSLRTGIEEPFLAGYRDRSFQYLLVVADRSVRSDA
jgi:geranyl diphosphate 2-C-methyltransferase